MAEGFSERMQALRKLKDAVFYTQLDIAKSAGWTYSISTDADNMTTQTFTKTHDGKILIVYSVADALSAECLLRSPKQKTKF